MTNILDSINSPKDLENLSMDQLKAVADEVRNLTIDAVSRTGGHLGAGLGVVELTVALHHVFDTPNDKLIWDVGHQTYPHKILTDRKNQIHTLRQEGGLSGFTKRSESPYDPFGAGHSSTSISAALGMAIGRDLKKENHEVIAVIGDGAMSAGMAYEAMNNASELGSRIIVILNDNKMSIAPAVGGLSRHLSRLISSRPYLTLRSMAKNVTKRLPGNFIHKAAKKAEQYTKDFWAGGNFFEEMGFYYVGPVNGHDLSQLVPILNNIKQDRSVEHPILVHVVTEKGHGMDMHDPKEEKLHAVGKFDVNTAKQFKKETSAPTYTNVFAEELTNQAKNDETIVAITAAMPSGTGLQTFGKTFPERMFDVGIAEQHAVTYAAGLACEGFKPFCCIYSTFLQRAYDQIIHDVAIQSLPVRFAIDRADLVGEDGPTHAGVFDPAFLATLPNFVIMAPSDEAELQHMVATSLTINDKPSAIRYPRGEGTGIARPTAGEVIPIGKSKVVQKGQSIAFISCGTHLQDTLSAAALLQDHHNITATVIDARFIKPIDKDLLREIANTHTTIITIEGSSIGGYGAHALDFLTNEKLIGATTPLHHFISLHHPDCFIDHGNIHNMYAKAGIDAKSIYQSAVDTLALDLHAIAS